MADKNYDNRIVVNTTNYPPDGICTLETGKTYTMVPYAGDGGAVDVEEDGTLLGTDITFADNKVAGVQMLAGAINNKGTVTLSGDAAFTGNSATSNGGAFYNEGAFTLGNAEFPGNSATGSGGVFYNNNGTVMITGNATFSENTATSGGAIYNDGTVYLNGETTFSGNTAVTGGAIRNTDSLYLNGDITVADRAGDDTTGHDTYGIEIVVDDTKKAGTNITTDYTARTTVTRDARSKKDAKVYGIQTDGALALDSGTFKNIVTVSATNSLKKEAGALTATGISANGLTVGDYATTLRVSALDKSGAATATGIDSKGEATFGTLSKSVYTSASGDGATATVISAVSTLGFDEEVSGAMTVRAVSSVASSVSDATATGFACTGGKIAITGAVTKAVSVTAQNKVAGNATATAFDANGEISAGDVKAAVKATASASGKSTAKAFEAGATASFGSLSAAAFDGKVSVTGFESTAFTGLKVNGEAITDNGWTIKLVSTDDKTLFVSVTEYEPTHTTLVPDLVENPSEMIIGSNDGDFYQFTAANPVASSIRTLGGDDVISFAGNNSFDVTQKFDMGNGNDTVTTYGYEDDGVLYKKLGTTANTVELTGQTFATSDELAAFFTGAGVENYIGQFNVSQDETHSLTAVENHLSIDPLTDDKRPTTASGLEWGTVEYAAFTTDGDTVTLNAGEIKDVTGYDAVTFGTSGTVTVQSAGDIVDAKIDATKTELVDKNIATVNSISALDTFTGTVKFGASTVAATGATATFDGVELTDGAVSGDTKSYTLGSDNYEYNKVTGTLSMVAA